MRMKNELRAVAGAAVMALLIAGCGSNPAPRPVIAHGVAVREPFVNPRPYGTADAAFGLDVLGAVCRSDPRSNLVLSPSSLASGLGMAYLFLVLACQGARAAYHFKRVESASIRIKRACGKICCKPSSIRCVPRPSGCKSTLPQVGQERGMRISRLQ